MNCPDCGHVEHFHRENGRTQNSEPDDPTPCFAIVAMRHLPGGVEEYDYCGCTTILPLAFV